MRGTVGLCHLAWQPVPVDELADAQLALAEAGALTGESSHGATLSGCGADPDGNGFEIMRMLPRAARGAYEHAAAAERLDLDARIARWPGVRTTWGLPDAG